MDSPDPTLCPLCGAPNGCALAAAGPGATPAAACWCRDQAFPAELLERVPQEARRRACICRRCLEKQAPAGNRQPGSGNRQP